MVAESERGAETQGERTYMRSGRATTAPVQPQTGAEKMRVEEERSLAAEGSVTC